MGAQCCGGATAWLLTSAASPAPAPALLQTTGALAPAQIVQSALTALTAKMAMLGDRCEQIKTEGSGALAAGAAKGGAGRM
jgi:hypothetical protein